MPYKTTRDVTYNDKTYVAGKSIPLDDDDDDKVVAAREQLLALDPPAIVSTAAKPLERMTKPELQAIADEEGVQLADGATIPMMIEAIKAKRAEAGA